MYTTFCTGFKTVPTPPEIGFLESLLTVNIIIPKKATDSTITVTASLFLKNFIFYPLCCLTIKSNLSKAFPVPSATQSRGDSAI